MRRFAVSTALLLTACSGQSGDQTQASAQGQVDIANAAATAQDSVDNYGAASAALRKGRAIVTPTPAPTATPSPASTFVDVPIVPGDAQDAAGVARTYFTLIEAGRYREAWRLWEDDGRASGMSADAFAASFARYSDHHAEIGAPGRIDAGAGQLYVTVPVKVRGRLTDGGRFAMAGPMTLHRVADVDAATVEQKSWRISASGVRPRPESR